MLVVEPGTHGSTYGGNPLGCAVSLRALELIEEEDMTAKAEKLGKIFREGVTSIKSPIVQLVRGKGLLNAVVIDESAANGRSAWDLCILLKEKGLLVSSSPVSADLSPFRLNTRPSSPPRHRRARRPAKQVETNQHVTGETNTWEHYSICSPVGHHRSSAEQGTEHHWGGAEGAAKRGAR